MLAFSLKPKRLEVLPGDAKSRLEFEGGVAFDISADQVDEAQAIVRGSSETELVLHRVLSAGAGDAPPSPPAGAPASADILPAEIQARIDRAQASLSEKEIELSEARKRRSDLAEDNRVLVARIEDLEKELRDAREHIIKAQAAVDEKDVKIAKIVEQASPDREALLVEVQRLRLHWNAAEDDCAAEKENAVLRGLLLELSRRASDPDIYDRSTIAGSLLLDAIRAADEKLGIAIDRDCLPDCVLAGTTHRYCKQAKEQPRDLASPESLPDPEIAATMAAADAYAAKKPPVFSIFPRPTDEVAGERKLGAVPIPENGFAPAFNAATANALAAGAIEPISYESNGPITYRAVVSSALVSALADGAIGQPPAPRQTLLEQLKATLAANEAKKPTAGSSGSQDEGEGTGAEATVVAEDAASTGPAGEGTADQPSAREEPRGDANEFEEAKDAVKERLDSGRIDRPASLTATVERSLAAPKKRTAPRTESRGLRIVKHVCPHGRIGESCEVCEQDVPPMPAAPSLAAEVPRGEG